MHYLGPVHRGPDLQVEQQQSRSSNSDDGRRECGGRRCEVERDKACFGYSE